MTNKKNKNNNQKITNFFKPLIYSKSAAQPAVSNASPASLAPQVKPKALADSTNTPQKKNAKSVHNPVKPLVFQIESSPAVSRLSPNRHPVPSLLYVTY